MHKNIAIIFIHITCLTINSETERMVKRKCFFTILAAILFLVGACSTGPGINKSKFRKAYVAAHEVKTSLAAGEPYRQVADRVKQLSVEIKTLKGTTEEEKELLDAYSDLLATYNDGLVLWKYKLDFAFFDSILKGRIYVGQDVEPIVLRYRFSTESHLYRPTGQYWKSIPGDSIRIIWSNADSQLKVIEGMTTY
jgi:hypothetical protein